MRCDAEAPEVPRGYLGEIVAPRTGSIDSEPAAWRTGYLSGSRLQSRDNDLTLWQVGREASIQLPAVPR
jgi:hypothetical protein